MSDPTAESIKPPWRVFWNWPTAGAVLAIVGLGLSFTALVLRKSPPPAPPPRTVVIQEIFGCQFMVCENPFFILHYPRCNAHGPGYPTNRLEVSMPMPDRPPNMPAP